MKRIPYPLVISLAVTAASWTPGQAFGQETPDAESAPAKESEETTAEPDAGKTETAPEDPSDRSPIDAVQGHIGIGYFTDFAPLGARIWFNRDLGIDIGLDGAFSSGNLEGYRLGADVGVVYAIAHYHYAVALFRGGLGYRVNEITGPQGVGARHDIVGNLFVGVELFLGALGFPNVSLQGGYGIQAAWTVEGGTSFVIGATEPELNIMNSGSVGFHIYL